MMTWLTWLTTRLTPHARPRVTPQEIRAELSLTDPDYARVRQAQHDALQALTAARIADGLAMSHEADFWRNVQGTDRTGQSHVESSKKPPEGE